MVDEVCRKMGISEATFFNWKKKFGGLGVGELRRLRQLEEENSKLKQLAADLSLDKQMLQDIFKKIILRQPQKRELVLYIQDNYRISLRRTCRLVMLSHSVWYYQPHAREDRLLRMRMKEISSVRIRYGFWRVYILLRREGFKDNHKRMYLYKQEGLNLRSKRPRRSKSAAHRMERKVSSINQCWSMDFVADL